MKILIAICFPTQGSGSGTLVTAQAAAYAQAGHEVHILLGHCREDFPRTKGVEYHLVPFTAENAPVKIEGQLPFNFPVFTTHPDTQNSFWSIGESELICYLTAFRDKLAEVVRDVAPDIIHAQHNWLLSEQCTHFCKSVVTTVHGTDLQAYLRAREELRLVNCALECDESEYTGRQALLYEKNRIYELYLRMAEESAKRANCLIAISKQQQELCRRLFPSAANKLWLIENGYDPEVFFPDETAHAELTRKEKRDEVLSLLTDGYARCAISREALICTDKLITFVGKFADYKGVDALINAMPLIVSGMKKNNRTVHLLIIGAGEMEDTLRELVRVRKLEQYVTFCAFQCGDAINKAHNISDVSVVPSRTEPFGLAAVEGLASGHPVVAANVGGLTDILTPAGSPAVSGKIIKTPLGLLTTPIPERLSRAEISEASECNVLISEYLYSDDASFKERVIKKLSVGLGGAARPYLNAYAESVSDLAESVLRVLSETDVFDPNGIAAYTKEHFSISGIGKTLISLFETVILNEGKSNEERQNDHT